MTTPDRQAEALALLASYIPLDNEKPDRTVNILQACLLHAPTSLGKRNVCNNILSCRSRATGEVDSSMLRNEADKYWNGVMAPMIAHGGRTPQVSSHLSRFSEHADALANEAMLQTTYRDQRTLKANALIRDRYRSVMGGAIDTRAFLTGLVPNASGAAMQLTYTEACHILPFSLTGGVGVPDEKAAVWAALRSFSGYNLLDELNGVAINRLANVITLSPDEHQAFGSLVCWLEAIEGEEHAYRVCGRVELPGIYPMGAVIRFTTPQDTLELPDHCFLEVHAACAKVLHASGMAEYVDKIMMDLEGLQVLPEDGSSHALSLALHRISVH